MPNTENHAEILRVAVEITVRLVILAIILYISYLIIRPFLVIITWGMIIAVTLTPLVDGLVKRFPHRKLVVIMLIGASALVILIPACLFSGKVFGSAKHLVTSMEGATFTLPAPSEKVKSWPIIGEKAYAVWAEASENLTRTLKPFRGEITMVGKKLFSLIGNGIGTILQFVFSLGVAAYLLMLAESASVLYTKVLCRFLGDEKRSEEWAHLSALTIRSVVTGVIGVAVIQACLAFIGLLLMQVPFGVLIALGVMFLTIIQMPPIVLLGPVIIYVLSTTGGAGAIVFSVYMFIISGIDGVLKPLLMGRGVDIPMLVILVGALGGMILMGMLGLFVGAVIFALTYKLFTLWISELDQRAPLDQQAPPDPEDSDAAEVAPLPEPEA